MCKKVHLALHSFQLVLSHQSNLSNCLIINIYCVSFSFKDLYVLFPHRLICILIIVLSKQRILNEIAKELCETIQNYALPSSVLYLTISLIISECNFSIYQEQTILFIRFCHVRVPTARPINMMTSVTQNIQLIHLKETQLMCYYSTQNIILCITVQ